MFNHVSLVCTECHVGVDVCCTISKLEDIAFAFIISNVNDTGVIPGADDI